MCSQSRRGVGLREFARRHGVTLGAVQRAIRDGRLTVARDRRGRPRIGDAASAAREWARTTQSDRRPVNGASARQRGTYIATVTSLAKARLERQELENAQRRGQLVDGAAMRARMADAFLHCRTKLLAVAAKAKSRLPHLTQADVLAIDALVRETLEDLASKGVETR